MRKSLAEHLSAARIGAGLTQAEVAQRLLVSQGAVANWELGRRAPTYDALCAVAMLYGHDDLGEFLRGVDAAEPAAAHYSGATKEGGARKQGPRAWGE